MLSNQKRRLDKARRHFLGLAAATGARVAAAGALAAMILPSSGAQAGNGNGNNGNGLGNGGGDGSNGNAYGHNKCYLRGTSILTPTGEVCVEELQIGDLVTTVSGKAMPVKWVGRNLYKRSGLFWDADVVPIRVSRHALADRTPHRDLYISAGHALLIEGTLIVVKDLVNGTSIVPVLPADGEEIEYFHVVLESHEVIIAEGVPAETFLLWRDNYESFMNFAEFKRLYPGSFDMKPFARVAGSESGRDHLKALLLLLGMGSVLPGIQPPSDAREPIKLARDRIAARAEQLTA